MQTQYVELVELNPGFLVRVHENGAETETRFEYRDFAKSWAAGQKIRLGLPLCEAKRNNH